MQTRYEWSASETGGEPTIVEVKRHVVKSLLWDSSNVEPELVYERSSPDSNKVVIVERLKRVVQGCDDRKIPNELSSDDAEDDLDSSFDKDDDDEVCSASSSSSEMSIEGDFSSDQLWKNLVKEDMVTEELQDEIVQLYREATESLMASLPVLSERETRASLRTTRSLATMRIPSSTPVPMPPACASRRPGLTRVRLLALLASPGYKEVLQDEGVWIARLCFDRGLKKNQSRISLGCPSFIDLLESTLKSPPEFVRAVEEEKGHNSWVVKLGPGVHDASLGEKAHFSVPLVKKSDLLIWQKVFDADFDKPTTWSLLYLPPGMSIPTFEYGEAGVANGASDEYIPLRLRLTVKGAPFFKAIHSVVGTTLTGFYTIRGVVDYSMLGHHTANEWFNDPSIPAKLDNAQVWLGATEQCTFCGLDCGFEGSPDEHTTVECPYKATLQRELSSSSPTTTR